jgi:hypothetical protein
VAWRARRRGRNVACTSGQEHQGSRSSLAFDGKGSVVVLVARSNIPGLRAARLAATEWASRSLPGIQVAGLVVMADAPGRLPKEIRDFSRVVGGGVPHVWHFPWVDGWRYGHDVAPEELPKEARTILEQVHLAVTATAALPAK